MLGTPQALIRKEAGCHDGKRKAEYTDEVLGDRGGKAAVDKGAHLGRHLKHWPAIEDLKRAAETLNFLTEHGTGSLEELSERCDGAAPGRNGRSHRREDRPAIGIREGSTEKREYDPLNQNVRSLLERSEDVVLPEKRSNELE